MASIAEPRAVEGGRPWAKPAMQWIAAHWTLFAVAGITVAAAAARLIALGDVPAGFNVDEAATGIDARRILSDGWIGPYTLEAQGQPTGPLYFAAAVLGLIGHGITEVRLSMAIIGIATIPVAYLAFREMTDRRTALIGALLLAFLNWHLHFSKLGFLIIAWPLMELAVIYFLLRALRTQSRMVWIAAGVTAGLGVYSYNAYGLFAVAVAAWVVYVLAFERSYRNWETLRGLAFMSVAAVVVALPLVVYALDGSNDYFEHHRQQWLFDYQGEIEGASPGASNLELMRVRADWFFQGFVENTQRDRVDGLGSLRVIDRYTLVLLVVGAVVALLRWRRSTSVLTFLVLALVFVAAVTTYDGLYRRTFGMAPFLCVVAAAPLAEIWRLGEQARPRVAGPLFACVGVILLLFAWSNISLHRRSTTTEWLHWLYMPETVAAVEYMGGIDGDPYVYFYSERISIKHDVPRYLAPDREGIDRSLEFDTNGAVLRERGLGPELRPSQAGDSLYVFLGAYLQQPLQDVQRLYPGGTLYEGRDDDGNVTFAAYRVDISITHGG